MTKPETTFCKGYGLPTYPHSPRKRRRTDDDDDESNPDTDLYNRRRRNEETPHRDAESPPRKRHTSNSFYGTHAARFGIVPASALCTLSHVAHIVKTSIAVGVVVSKHIPDVVCKSFPAYIRDVHRARVVRDVFERMRRPEEENLDSGSEIASGLVRGGRCEADGGACHTGESRSGASEVAMAMAERHLKDGRRRGGIFTSFSIGELRASRSRSATRNTASVSSSPQPARSTTRCPLCHFDSPSISTFCTAYLTPFPPGRAPRSYAQGIVAHDILPDILTSPIDGKQATLVTYPSTALIDKSHLCTGAAGPPGTLTASGSHVRVSAEQYRRLLHAREQAWREDSEREVRDQEHRKLAAENGLHLPAHNGPYFSDIQEEEATKEALRRDRSAEAETAWMWKLAELRAEAEEDKVPFPLNVPGYGELEDGEVARLEGDVEVLDRWLASMEDTATTIRPATAGRRRKREDSAALKQEADRTERLKAIQQREVDRQYLEHIADLQRQAVSLGYKFPEGVPGWKQVDPAEKGRSTWAIYTNQMNDMSEAKGKMAGVAPSSNPTRTRDDQARVKHYTRLKQKFAHPKWVERVGQIGELRSSILCARGRWPEDVQDWEKTPEEFKKCAREVTAFLEMGERYET
jgi:hypothetical protein